MNLPKRIVDNLVLFQNGKKPFLHSTVHNTIVALVDAGFNISFGFANTKKFLQLIWLEVGNTELAHISLSHVHRCDTNMLEPSSLV